MKILLKFKISIFDYCLSHIQPYIELDLSINKNDVSKYDFCF